MYLLLGLTYLFSRCTFGELLATKSVSSWLSRTRVADVNRFLTMLNTLVVKILLVLRLRAIWNKDFISEKARIMANGLIILTFLNYSHTNFIFHDGRYVLHNFISDWWRWLMVDISWGPGRLYRQYDTWPTSWSYFSDFYVCDDNWHMCWLSFQSATPSPWLLDKCNTSYGYRKQSW